VGKSGGKKGGGEASPPGVENVTDSELKARERPFPLAFAELRTPRSVLVFRSKSMGASGWVGVPPINTALPGLARSCDTSVKRAGIASKRLVRVSSLAKFHLPSSKKQQMIRPA